MISLRRDLINSEAFLSKSDVPPAILKSVQKHWQIPDISCGWRHLEIAKMRFAGLQRALVPYISERIQEVTYYNRMLVRLTGRWVGQCSPTGVGYS